MVISLSYEFFCIECRQYFVLSSVNFAVNGNHCHSDVSCSHCGSDNVAFIRSVK
jgi:hypothetical protein